MRATLHERPRIRACLRSILHPEGRSICPILQDGVLLRQPLRASHWLILSGLVLALLFPFLMPAPLHGESHVTTIMGQVVNGTSGAAAPADLEVTLHIFGNSGEVDTTTAMTDSNGRFRFQSVAVNENATYAVTASYQDVLYSSRLDPQSLTEPVELLVYDNTNTLEALRVVADVLLISGSGGDKKSLGAFEVVRLANGGDRTFVPDLAQPGSMSFLRFSLPSGATSLDVRSDLPGGEIITIGTGFALTAPVTPGSHQVTYTYRLPYNGSRVEISRSFPLGAEDFRLLMEDELGNLKDPGFLTLLSPVEVEGKTFQVWEASRLTPGARLTVEIGDLPQPHLPQRIGDALADGPYLKVGIPAAVGLVLAGLLLYALVFKQARESPATGPEFGASAAVLSADVSGEPKEPPKPALILPGKDEGSERRALVEAIARLDDLFQQGEIAQDGYHGRRQGLKARLLQLSLTSKE